jgi:hypothetical protein
MDRYLMFFVLLFLFSCNTINDEVYYTYNNVTIKRIDTNGKTEFYYMKNGKEAGKIWAEYSGINDGFAGYLKFEENGKVSILDGDGYFQKDNIDNLNFKFRTSIQETNYNMPNMCIIWYPIEAEQEKNKKSLSKVKIKYVRQNPDGSDM